MIKKLIIGGMKNIARIQNYTKNGFTKSNLNHQKGKN